MARGKKSGPSRLDLRRQSEAAEAREEEEEELEDEEVADDDADADGDADADEGGDDEDSPKPKAKAKKAVVKKKATTTKRTRAVKEVRMRAVWKVFDNSNKVIDTFPFNQKAEAEELLAKKIEEKKGTFYLQMVKEQMEVN